ncbi:MAG: hypothetical protein H7293_20085 [Candidatus Saccharibacteria bacterium]|nr:hypothetical protein [Rhodoferax sp.]
MTVSNAEFLKGNYNAARLLGNKSINSDGTMEIEGFESLLLLTKQFPWPTIGSSGEIVFPGPLGTESAAPQQIKIYQQGPITFQETSSGAIHRFMQDVVARGGRFQAVVYEGVPEAFYRAYKLVDAFFVPDQPDRDFENKAQGTLINGTLHFHFFNETLPGNIAA